MQHRTLRRVMLSFAVVIVAVGSLTLLSCGSDEETRNVNTTIPLNAATAAANDTAILNGKTFTVPGATLAANTSTPALATALQGQTTSVTFSGVSGANGSFSTANPTTSGTVRFASCTFTVTAPANLAGTITIQNCSVNVQGTAVPVDGGSTTGSATLVLNGTSSTNTVTVTVSIDASGQLTVDGEPTTFTVTGTSGG